MSWVEAITRILPLSRQESQALERVQAAEHFARSRDVIYRAGAPLDELYFVTSGWLYRDADLPDGRRQILTLHGTSDVIGLGELGYRVSDHNLRACTAAQLVAVRRAAFSELLLRAPRIAGVFLALAAREQARLGHALRVVSRMNADARIAYLLVYLAVRVSGSTAVPARRFQCPLTQDEIADFLGLTNVYVSKTLRRMETSALIARRRDWLELRDLRGLQRLCAFAPGSESPDFQWLRRRRHGPSRLNPD